MKINFQDLDGKIKYMNAVNNGPTAPNVRLKATNFDLYKAAGISYARNHDASFFQGYGGEHTVDVHRIFKNFDADENDPVNYIFEPTDKYLQNIIAAGTKVYYRLGSSIEHGFKYGTYPPKDFAKWARICEHIIRHYTEGWANGFYMDIEYWEIWNEPDCYNADGSNPCWQGTREEFVEFFCTALGYLKEKFPHLKIGGPAIMSLWESSEDLIHMILSAVKERNLPLDFFSFHWYGHYLEKLQQTLDKAENIVRSYGFNDAELILNEWNYVYGWADELWEYTIKHEQGLKGASFIVGAMSLCQASALDMLMYYDARPCVMNGMFEDKTYRPLKGYYPFIMFKDLLDLGTYVKAEVTEQDIYTCAATSGTSHAIMVTHYNNDDKTPAKEVKIDFSNLGEGIWNVQYYLLNQDHNLELVRSEKVTSGNFTSYLNMSLFSSYLIKFTKEQ